MFHSFPAFFTSAGLVALSEMGDKTQLLAFSLSARYRRPGPILGGILVATVVNHALAASAGSWIAGYFSPKTAAIGIGALFLAFGFWTLKPDTLEESETKRDFGPFWTTIVLFFLAEMGDKTQLATAALGARYEAPLTVTAGTTLGMMVSDGLAVFLGHRLSDRIPMKLVRWSAATLFFAFGIWSVVEGIGGADPPLRPGTRPEARPKAVDEPSLAR